VVAAFQPQRYTRTYFLFNEFSRAFANADEVLITDIYSPAGEQPIEGVHSAALVEAISRNSNQQVRHIATNGELLQWLHEHAQEGDVVITMGAGDIWRVAHQFHNELQ
jgi:UDP-N-acetylmuramate--alanine ligase